MEALFICYCNVNASLPVITHHIMGNFGSNCVCVCTRQWVCMCVYDTQMYLSGIYQTRPSMYVEGHKYKFFILLHFNLLLVKC